MDSLRLAKATIFFFLIFLSVSVAQATTMLPMTLEHLVERSDIVAHVRVGEVTVVDTDEAPFRVTQLEVIEPFRGNARPGDVLPLWQRGDGYVFVLGDPWLETGQEGLAFLVQEQDRAYLTGLAQSWWHIDPVTLVAQRDLSSIHIVQNQTTGIMPPNQAPWAELRALIQGACGIEVSP